MIGSVGSELEWRPLRGIDKNQLREARLQAHYAVQWLARAARAYIPPQPDDGHTSLRWDGILDGFVTHPLEDGTRLSMEISSLALKLRDGGGSAGIQSLSLAGHSDAQIGQWLGERLRERGFDAKTLNAKSPYEIPTYAIARGAFYDTSESADALTQLAAWFANAEGLLDQIQKQIAGRGLAASPVCCWPHHFDLATLTTLPKSKAVSTGYVGVGLSPGDAYYDEPYFYISMYPKPDPATLPSLPKLGHWHTREFMAAVLPAHRILAVKNQKTEAYEFLQDAVDIALKILS